jgi:tetratricopeptide (TPR) repeat protein
MNGFASKKPHKFYQAINLFAKAVKKAKNDNDKALAFQMLGKVQYCLEKYGSAEKSLKCALNLATDCGLIDNIRFDIAMVNLHISSKIWVMHDGNMSWLFSVTKADRWKYVLKSMFLSIRTRSVYNMRKTFQVVKSIIHNWTLNL